MRGDTFDVVLQDGMHVAAIVLRVFERYVVFSVLDYHGRTRAKLDSEGMRKLYTCRNWRGLDGRCPTWVCTFDVPLNAYLGRIEELDEEYELFEELESVYPWRDEFANAVYWDRFRREDPERADAAWLEHVEALRRADRERARARASKRGPGRLMPEDRFWALLAPEDPWFDDPDAAADACVARLADCSAKQILLFEKTLTYRLFQLDTKAHAKAFSGRGYLSPDAFLYARCAVVAAGREVFDCVLRIPEAFPKDLDVEALLEVARRAYEEVTGEDLEPTWDLDYETGSNVAGWEE